MTEQEEKPGRTWTETIEVVGKDLLNRAKELVAEGNVRRLIIRKPSGDLLLEVPLTAGAVVGGVVTIAWPLLAALVAVGALMARVRVEIVRCDGDSEQ